jgi:hypothetical protein
METLKTLSPSMHAEYIEFCNQRDLKVPLGMSYLDYFLLNKKTKQTKLEEFK